VAVDFFVAVNMDLWAWGLWAGLVAYGLTCGLELEACGLGLD
jgi:hypothetical protein